jgi:hypothetical protein
MVPSRPALVERKRLRENRIVMRASLIGAPPAPQASTELEHDPEKCTGFQTKT